jgi:tetratricopeptide (TPR) repeat protein
MGRFIRGDVREAEVDLDSAARVADELRQPAQLWLVRATQAMLALALGSLNEAGELVPEALTLGERAQPEWAVSAYTIHQYTFGDFQGRPEESEAPIRSLVAAYPSRPVFRCALAHLYAKQGRSLEASQELADLAGDTFSAIPFDVEWLFGMSLLAETAALLDDTGSGAVLYELLLPWAAWNAADMAEGIRGSISHYLGLLAAASERLSDAEQHFEDALNSNERMGLIPWLARTRHEYARMLLARDGPGDRERAERVLGEAQTAYRELGMNGYAAEAAVLAGKARFPSADG